MTKTAPNIAHALRPRAESQSLVPFSLPTSAYSVVTVPERTADSDASEKARKLKKTKIEGAVFAHIQALRTLDKTEVSVREISRSLNLHERDVLDAINSLGSKGVKLK